MSQQRGDDGAVVALEPVIRRVLAPRAPPGTLDDVVQETLVRVLEARGRLSEESLVAYAVIVARNVLASEFRRAERERRGEHRLFDPLRPDTPEAVLLAAEEQAAVREALSRLSPADRDSLVDRDVEGAATAGLAERRGSTPGAVATKVARARARLRVEYVLAFRRLRLPSDRCHPVLMSLSAGDQRRQRQLRVQDHLLHCAACAAVAPALVERRRGLAALIPAGAGVGGPRRLSRSRAAQAATAVGMAGVVIVAAMVFASRDEPRKPPPPGCSALGADGSRLAAVTADALAGYVGRQVELKGASVVAVPANEGFWVSCGATRVWVQLIVRTESRVRVAPAHHVDVRATVVPHGADFPERVGVTAEEGAGELAGAGVHLEVGGPDVKVLPP